MNPLVSRWTLGRCTAALLACLPVAARAQHVHLNAGARSPDPGSPLYFANGDSFTTNSGRVISLAKAESGPYAGFFTQAGLTLTALASTSSNGGPAFGHAAPGAHLELVVLGVQGPAGGALGFWDSDGESDAQALTFSVPVGETAGQQRFRLSENDGSPGSDPYGHVHGRRFTTDHPGLYAVTVQLIDTSANGVNGAPLHPPSDPFSFYLQAGVSIARLELLPGGARVTFATQTGRRYFLERTSRPTDSTSWTTEVGPLEGNDHLQTLEISGSTGIADFYRLRVE